MGQRYRAGGTDDREVNEMKLSRTADFGAAFLVIGVIVVVTLITMPFVGRFFTTALLAGAVLGAVLAWWRRR